MICGCDYSRQAFLKSCPPSFPFLHLKFVNRTQLWNFTILWNGTQPSVRRAQKKEYKGGRGGFLDGEPSRVFCHLAGIGQDRSGSGPHQHQPQEPVTLQLRQNGQLQGHHLRSRVGGRYAVKASTLDWIQLVSTWNRMGPRENQIMLHPDPFKASLWIRSGFPLALEGYWC